MDLNVMCSEDGISLAVCSCFCRFPLPAVCAACLSKHEMRPDVFQHFHLPLYASQWITSAELRAQYSQWFFGLHNAYSLLWKNEGEITRFEEQVEGARLEVVHQLEQHVEDVKQRLAGLRAAYKSEVQRAIEETSAHAMEEWSPDSESLSSLVWNYCAADPVRLKVFRLWTEVGSVSQTLQVSIETTLSSLSAFSKPKEVLEQRLAEQLQAELEQTRRELAETSGKNKELAEENETLKKEVQQLHARNAEFSEELEELRKSSESQIRTLNDENVALRLSLSEEPQGVAARPTSERPLQHPNERRFLDESNAPRGFAALLKEGLSEKAAFHYRESAQFLQQSWDLVQSAGDKQTAAVGAALGEVLGVHLGKSAEAIQVLSKSLEIETQLNRTSEEVTKLNNLLVEVCFLQGKYGETRTICWRALSSYSGNSEHYWAIGFYAISALCELSQLREAEIMGTQLMQKPFRTKSQLTEALKLCVKGKLLFATSANAEAESLFANAYQIVTREYPVSIYAALIGFWLGQIYSVMKQSEKGKEILSKAEILFADHFPNTIWAAQNLAWLGTVCNDLGQREIAMQKRLAAQRIFEVHSPSDINTAENLTRLAELYQSMGQREVAVQKRLEAHRIYETNFKGNINTAWNLSKLGLLYNEMNQMDEAIQFFDQARSLFLAFNPTSNDAAMTLFNLGCLYEKKQKNEVAFNHVSYALRIWSANSSANAQSLAVPVLTRLQEKLTR